MHFALQGNPYLIYSLKTSTLVNFGRPIFRATMPRERFKVILRFLRFDDFSTRTERSKTDNLAPIRYIFDSVIKRFPLAYIPGKYITVDEHLCRFRGKCKFRQYLPNKPDKYGLKVWIIADSRTFYPMNAEVYTGKCNFLSNSPEDITLRLVSAINPGHVIVGDNLFTSLSLSKRLLLDHNLFYLGTVRQRRRFLPKSIRMIKGIPIYSSTFYFSDNHTLVSYIPKKGRSVILMSNIHHHEEISDTPKRKPNIILTYNKHKIGVDKLDQMNKEYRPYRSTRRWPCVLFFDLISLATHASWVLFCLK